MLATTGARPKIFLANLGTRRRVHAARELCQNLLRGRRHRSHHQRWLQEPRRDDRGVQSVGREARLPVLIRCGLCSRGHRRRQGAGSGRRSTYLSGRAAEGCRCAQSRRRRNLHLRRLRRGGDLEGRARCPWNPDEPHGASHWSAAVERTGSPPPQDRAAVAGAARDARPFDHEDIVWAALTLPGIALLCLLVARSCIGCPAQRPWRCSVFFWWRS